MYWPEEKLNLTQRAFCTFIFTECTGGGWFDIRITHLQLCLACKYTGQAASMQMVPAVALLN